MNDQSIPNAPHYQDDEIDLRELFGILWGERKLLIAFTTVAAIISIVVSLSITEIYHAEVTLAAADTEQGAGGLMNQLGGAAALLGVNVNNNSSNNISTALAILESRQFINQFINDNQILVPMFAEKYDKDEKTTFIDARKYNSKDDEWLLKSGKPTEQEAYREFVRRLTVSGPDRATGILTIGFDWHNPAEAARWLNQLIRALNKDIRLRDIREANSAISYLQKQLENTQLVDMQQVFYQLIESQTRIIMLADVRDEYLFRVIDPATEPDQKTTPRRGLICIAGSLSGIFLALLFIFVRRILTK